MKYSLLKTDKANDQLYSLIQYVANDSGSIDTALNYLDRIEAAVNRLSEFPYSGTPPRYSILKKQGYRVLIFEKLLIFYRVDDSKETVTVHAVVSSKMEYMNLI